jgi:lysophospholipase L1-like esterase
MIRSDGFRALLIATSALLTAAAPPEPPVVFFGDSITEAWAPRFAAQFPGKPYVGRGISGQTTPQMLARFEQDVVALQPSVVVILAGTNDIAGNAGPMTLEMTEDNLRAMTEMARRHGIRVVLSSVLPVFDYPWKPGLEPAPKIIALNAWIKRYAAEVGETYLDYHSAMVDSRGGLPQSLARDGVHPNEAGYRLMAPLAEAAIAQALSRSESPERTERTDPAETTRVLTLEPGVTVTLVAPARLDPSQPVDLILYALPNGNSTAQTMGRTLTEGLDWHFDIQHIAAQTRALRERGYEQAVVAYLEADGRSWPAWRAKHGHARANARIVEMVDEIRREIRREIRAGTGEPATLHVTLAGHSGGGSFAFGFIDGQDALPDWLVRIAFLDSNYSFEPRHGDALLRWLRADADHRLVVMAYDDREIMLDGKKVVSDSGGTWRATERMLRHLSASVTFTRDTLGEFARERSAQVEILRHPNPVNRILHTEMIGEMNGYMHALLSGRAGYTDANSVLKAERAYRRFVDPARPE